MPLITTCQVCPVGLGVRALLLQLLPDAYLAVILMRAMALCLVGLGTYVTLARVLGVAELSELEGLVLQANLNLGLQAHSSNNTSVSFWVILRHKQATL
jgi:hypothetical protein